MQCIPVLCSCHWKQLFSVNKSWAQVGLTDRNINSCWLYSLRCWGWMLGCWFFSSFPILLLLHWDNSWVANPIYTYNITSHCFLHKHWLWPGDLAEWDLVVWAWIQLCWVLCDEKLLSTITTQSSSCPFISKPWLGSPPPSVHQTLAEIFGVFFFNNKKLESKLLFLLDVLFSVAFLCNLFCSCTEVGL